MSESNVGKINVYTCPVCGYHTVTIDVDDGVTPAFIFCVACGSDAAASSFYQAPQHYCPEMEWFKPTDEELRQVTRRQLAECSEEFALDTGFNAALGINREYRDKGGLFLRHVRRETLKKHHASIHTAKDYVRGIDNCR